ncbi:MAG: hypothetical protein NTV02_01155 [Candidatus Zambryskibacteria bacterium]|nr:hypothetical protein [Candidatus Zambryskibacteria bacterium]
MKILYIACIALLCCVGFCASVFAEVSQFTFVTKEQVVAPQSISGPLTIQSQSSGGVGESVVETMDMFFQSSSATGKFLGSSGKTASKTMSKNTSNRTFYYTDPTLGKHTITVKVMGRTSKKSYTTTQSIFIGIPSATVQTTVLPSVSKKEVLKESKKVLVKVPQKPVSKSYPVDIKNTISKTEVSDAVPISSSTVPEIHATTSSIVANVQYSTQNPSALESMLWLPRKIWSTLLRIF